MYGHPNALMTQAFPPPGKRGLGVLSLKHWLGNSYRGLRGVTHGVCLPAVTYLRKGKLFYRSGSQLESYSTGPRGRKYLYQGGQGNNIAFSSKALDRKDLPLTVRAWGNNLLLLIERASILFYNPGTRGGWGPLDFYRRGAHPPTSLKAKTGSCKYYRYETRRRPEEV